MDKKNNSLTFSVEYADLVKKDDTFSIVELDLLHLGVNRNGSVFTKEGVEKSLDSIQNKPIICIYNCNARAIASDYTSHASNDDEFENIVCIGLIPMKEFSEPRFVTTDDGYERLRMKGLLWSFYNDTAIDILQKQNDEARVSIEVEPLETHEDEKGNLVIDKFNFLGCSLLSNSVMEGMKGSKMKVLKYSVDEMIAKGDEYLSTFAKSAEPKDIIEKIKEIKGGKMKLGHRELEQQIWNALSGEYFVKNGESFHKYYVEDIYDSHIVVGDNETGEEIKFKYDVDEEGKVHIDFTTRKVIDVKKLYRTYAKEDIATEDELKIDKDKISEDAWGSIDKGNLRERIVKAKNFKTIAKEVFLDLREGWEDGEVSKLKYPVMQLDGDTLVYNRGALAAAKGYAEKNNETEVLAKLKKIYAHLKLEFEVNCENATFECSCEDYVCGDKNISKSEDIDENKDDDVKPDEEEKEEPAAGPQEDKDAKDAKDDTEVRETDTKDEIKMSADENVDGSAQQEMLNKEAENNKELAGEQNASVEQEVDKDKVIAELTDKVAAYEIELAELRKFKNDTMELRKASKIEQVFSEVAEDLSTEQKEKFKAMAQEYSFENIEVWANAVKAEAFNAAKSKTQNTTKFQRIDVWDLHETPQTKKGLWD